MKKIFLISGLTVVALLANAATQLEVDYDNGHTMIAEDINSFAPHSDSDSLDSSIDFSSLPENREIDFDQTENNGSTLEDFYFNTGKNNVSLEFTIHGDSFLLSESTKLNGEPLPGFLAAMMLGGGFAYSAYRRKRQ